MLGGYAHRGRGRDFLAFMNEVVATYPARELHVILDNLNTHQGKLAPRRARRLRMLNQHSI